MPTFTQTAAIAAAAALTAGLGAAVAVTQIRPAVSSADAMASDPGYRLLKWGAETDRLKMQYDKLGRMLDATIDPNRSGQIRSAIIATEGRLKKLGWCHTGDDGDTAIWMRCDPAP